MAIEAGEIGTKSDSALLSTARYAFCVAVDQGVTRVVTDESTQEFFRAWHASAKASGQPATIWTHTVQVIAVRAAMETVGLGAAESGAPDGRVQV